MVACRLVRALLCSVAVAAAMAAGGCGNSDKNTPTIDVVTSHGANIRREFAQAFSDWHLQKYGTAVKINYPDIGGGGTGNIAKYLDAQYRSGASSTFDIAWGGGSATFNTYMPFLVKPDLPAAVLEQVPHDIFGTPLHGPDEKWIAATMSNFGIVVNKDRMSELGLATPRVWTDIAAPAWMNDLSIGDPLKSGSVLTSYDMIFAQYGWEKGWGTVSDIFANAEVIRDNGASPGDDVGSAEAVAGIVIDFYGRSHAIRVGPRIVEFIIPQGGSTIDPDPIAMLKGAPHAELAAHFIEFVISPEGQRLWVFKNGVPGGPKRNVLGRLSVLPELYEKESASMFDATNPWKQAEALKADPKLQADRRAFLGELIKATLVDNHDALVAARRAIHAAGDSPDLLQKLDAPPTFAVVTRSASGDLVFGDWVPLSGDKIGTLAEEFKSKDPAMAPLLEQLQQAMQNHWRSEYEARARDVLAAAQAARGARH